MLAAPFTMHHNNQQIKPGESGDGQDEYQSVGRQLKYSIGFTKKCNIRNSRPQTQYRQKLVRIYKSVRTTVATKRDKPLANCWHQQQTDHTGKEHAHNADGELSLCLYYVMSSQEVQPLSATFAQCRRAHNHLHFQQPIKQKYNQLALLSEITKLCLFKCQTSICFPYYNKISQTDNTL